MKTVIINTAGKRSSAFLFEQDSCTKIFNGERKTKITVTEAKKMIAGKNLIDEGANYKTYKID